MFVEEKSSNDDDAVLKIHPPLDSSKVIAAFCCPPSPNTGKMSDYSGSSRSNTPAPGGEGCQEESLLVRGGGRDYEDGIAADDDDPDETRVTCDVLCSLSGVVGGTMISSSSSYPACTSSSPAESIVHDHEMSDLSNPCKKLCPKQHQLPMFLSSKFPRRRKKRSLGRKSEDISM